MSILRRSTRTLRVRQSSSATSVGVTEPKSEPVGPALTSKRSTVFGEDLGDLLGLLGRARLVARTLALDALHARRRAPGVATSASWRGSRKLRA